MTENLFTLVKKSYFKLQKVLSNGYFFGGLLACFFGFGCFAIVVGNYSITIISLILSMLYILLTSGKNALLLSICCLIPSPMLIGNNLPLTYPTLLFIFYVLVLFLRLLVKRSLLNVVQENLRFFGLYLILLVYGLTVLFINTGFGLFDNAISFYIYLLLPLFAKCDDKAELSLSKLSFWFLLVHLVSMLIAIPFATIQCLYDNYWPLVDTVGGKAYVLFQSRLSGFCRDQNQLSLITTISLSFTIFGYELINHKKIMIIMSVGSFLLTLLAQSKSFLICVFIILLLLVFKVGKKYRSYILIGTSIILFALAIITASLPYNVIAGLLGRFVTETEQNQSFLDTITTNRWSIWMEYIRYQGNHPINFLFGYGPRTIYYFRIDQMPVTHNFLLNLLWEFGLLGTPLFLAVFFLSFLPNEKTRMLDLRDYIAIASPIIVFLVFSMSLSLTGSLEINYLQLFSFLLIRETINKKIMVTTRRPLCI